MNEFLINTPFYLNFSTGHQYLRRFPNRFYFSIIPVPTFRSSTLCTNCLCSYNLSVAILFILNNPWPTLRILATHTRTLLLDNFKSICNFIMHMSIHISNFSSLWCLFMLQSFLMRKFLPGVSLTVCNLSSHESLLHLGIHLNPFLECPVCHCSPLIQGLTWRAVIRRLQWGFTLLSFYDFRYTVMLWQVKCLTWYLRLLQNTYMKKDI